MGNRAYQGRQHRAAYRHYTEALQLKVGLQAFGWRVGWPIIAAAIVGWAGNKMPQHHRTRKLL